MQYVSEEVFHFLERSPYFYKKEKHLNSKGSDEFTRNREENVEQLNYIFFEQDNNDHIIAEISIPVKNPHEEVKWKLIQLNDKISKPTFQSANPNLDIIPFWFKSLVLETQNSYEDSVLLFRCFGGIPLNKN